MSELTTLARPYARAAFEHAADAGALAQWSEALATLAAVTQERTVRQLLSSPSQSSSRQVEIIQSLLDGQLTPAMSNFVAVLGKNRRLLLLSAIREQFEVLKANRERSLEVEVKTAAPIGPTQSEQLAQALSKRLDCRVNITTTLDKSLLGGVLIRAGDTIIDGSIRGRLIKLAEALNS